MGPRLYLPFGLIDDGIVREARVDGKLAAA